MSDILLVDDDPLVTRALARLLQSAHSVRVALSEEAALAAIGERAPDVIVSDYMLGTTTAMNLLRKVRSLWPGIRIVLYSGSLPESWDALVKDGTVDVVLRKPCSVEELRRAVA